jgi:hypothetical protein
MGVDLSQALQRKWWIEELRSALEYRVPSDEELIERAVRRHPEALTLLDVLRDLGFFAGLQVVEHIDLTRARRDKLVYVEGVGKLYMKTERGLEPVFVRVVHQVDDPWMLIVGQTTRELPGLFVIRLWRRIRNDPEWLKKYLKYKLREIKRKYNLVGELTPAKGGVNEWYELRNRPFREAYYDVVEREDGRIEVYRIV